MVPRGRLELLDTRIFSAMLYQLSYLGTLSREPRTNGCIEDKIGAVQRPNRRFFRSLSVTFIVIQRGIILIARGLVRRHPVIPIQPLRQIKIRASF